MSMNETHSLSKGEAFSCGFRLMIEAGVSLSKGTT